MNSNSLCISGIYIMYYECDDGQYYIGMSTNIASRYKWHCNKLTKNIHKNKQLSYGYTKYNKLPTIQILEEVINTDDLSIREVYWISIYDSFRNGMNETMGGEGTGYGENNVNALYSKQKYVDIMKALGDPSKSMIEISKELEVNYNVVIDISIGGSHKYLEIEYPEDYYKMIDNLGKRTCNLYKDNVYVSILKELANTNNTFKNISDSIGVTESVIRNISKGNTHKYLQESHPELYQKMLDKLGTRKSGPTSRFINPSVISPEGVTYTITTNINAFVKEHNLDSGNFYRVLRGKSKSHKGWALA